MTTSAERPGANDAGGRALSVIVAGGGTAGHIEPAMAVADALRRLDPSIRVTALGTRRGLETTLVPERGYPLELIPPVPLPRKPTADLLRLPGRVRAAVARAREVINVVQADVIIGFGGYVALPAYLAAGRGLRGRRAVPVVVHEANVKAGIANKIGARRAARVLAAVANSGVRAPGRADAEIVGIPVRQAIATLDRAGLRAAARESFGLPADGPVLLVFGGSQGARTLNEAVSAAAPQLLEAGISVLHAHGPKNAVEVASGPGDGEIHCGAACYSSHGSSSRGRGEIHCGAVRISHGSGLCRGRCGGVPGGRDDGGGGLGGRVCRRSTCRCRTVTGSRSSTPARSWHWAAAGSCADAELTAKYVIDEVIPLLTDPARLSGMSVAAAGAGHRDAADAVARIVVEVAAR